MKKNRLLQKAALLCAAALALPFCLGAAPESAPGGGGDTVLVEPHIMPVSYTHLQGPFPGKTFVPAGLLEFTTPPVSCIIAREYVLERLSVRYAAI